MPATDKYSAIIADIHRYMSYIDKKYMTGFSINFLPLSKGYDEHPYWLIKKLEFILKMVNKVDRERR